MFKSPADKPADFGLLILHGLFACVLLFAFFMSISSSMEEDNLCEEKGLGLCFRQVEFPPKQGRPIRR